MTTPPDIATGLRTVHERIARACDRAGRTTDSVRLVAISKTFSAERVSELLAAGHDLLGENRVQEALEKQKQVGPGPIWHLVGHLQRNKVKQIVGAFELIHSVDSARLANEIERCCAARETTQSVLIQVNLSREETKSGVDEESLQPLLETIAGLEHVSLQGLMTIPPPAAKPEDARRWFNRLYELCDEAASWLGRPLPELSMGMTNDFEVAVEEGATLVRVGRAIFGERT